MENKYRLLVIIGLVVVGLGLWVRGQIASSQIIGQNYRHSVVMASSEGEVVFLSFDPEEKRVMTILWPSNLMISSRSVGSYQISDLYKLGSYDGEPGEFVRQKVQGYMKTPVMSYVQVEGELGRWQSKFLLILWSGKKVSNMSRLDALILGLRSISYDTKNVEISELLRAGVLSGSEEKYEYQAGRLQQFLGKRIFDWGVGGEGLSVAVINQSEIAGLATDVAGVLENAGLSVVAVRNGALEGAETQIIISSELSEEQEQRVRKMLTAWFGWENIQMGDTAEYRAEIVMRLGEDAEELF